MPNAGQCEPLRGGSLSENLAGTIVIWKLRIIVCPGTPNEYRLILDHGLGLVSALK